MRVAKYWKGIGIAVTDLFKACVSTGTIHKLWKEQGTSRFLAQGGADAPPPPLGEAKGGHFEVKEGHPIFTNNMIFLECGVIALFEAFYMLRDHNHVKMKF